jgi:hypothetical protein
LRAFARKNIKISDLSPPLDGGRCQGWGELPNVLLNTLGG